MCSFHVPPFEEWSPQSNPVERFAADVTSWRNVAVLKKGKKRKKKDCESSRCIVGPFPRFRMTPLCIIIINEY